MPPEVSDVAESGAQQFSAGVSPLAFATEALSRNAGAFARLYEPAGGTPLPRAGTPRGASSPAELSGQIAALLASFDRRQDAIADDVAPHGLGRPRSLPDDPSLPARERPFSPAGSFALSLAWLAGEDRNGAAADGTSQAPFTGRRPRAASLPRGLFAGGHAALEDSPPDDTSLDGPSLEGRRGHDRQQRQLETLLRIERLLDEAVRLLRQPRPAVFAADSTGVP